MGENPMWQRVLLCGSLAVSTAIISTGSAEAATQCFSQSYSDGAKVVPGTGGGNMTRAIARQQAANTWNDVIWRGKSYTCNKKKCKHEFSESRTTTTSWAVGGGTDLGNSSSPSKKWYNFVIPLVAGYSKTTNVTTTATYGVTLDYGDVSRPAQIAIRRWTQGDFAGGWVRTNRGCRGGTIYEWNGNTRFGKWTRNVFVDDAFSFEINGRLA